MKTRYAEFYNRAGMLDDSTGPALRLLPEDERFALIEEHHRRTDAIAEAYAERGEVIDYHDARFEDGAAAERCPKCGGTHQGRYEGACLGPPTPSQPPPHRMQG